MEFHMLCGVPGSGKSTLGKELSGYTKSTDSIRKFLWDDESILKHDQLVFRIAEIIMEYILSSGGNIIFDATNLMKQGVQSIYI